VKADLSLLDAYVVSTELKKPRLVLQRLSESAPLTIAIEELQAIVAKVRVPRGVVCEVAELCS